MIVDMVGSTPLKVTEGDLRAVEIIADTLNRIEKVMMLADPSAVRNAPSAGDDFVLIGGNPFALFMAAVDFQRQFREWQKHHHLHPVRIGLGFGRHKDTQNGQFHSLRGISIDIVKVILSGCRPAGVVVTPGMWEIVRGAGYAHLMARREIVRKDGEIEHFYAVTDETDNRAREARVMEPTIAPESASTKEVLTVEYFEKRIKRIEERMDASDRVLLDHSAVDKALHEEVQAFMSITKQFVTKAGLSASLNWLKITVLVALSIAFGWVLNWVIK
jgi:hypothetical protein